MYIFIFILIFILVAIFVGTIAGAIAYHVKNRPQEIRDTVHEIHKAAEKLTAPAKPLINVLQYSSTTPSSTQALVAQVLGTDEYLHTTVSKKPVTVEAFIQQLGLDESFTSIDEIRSGYENSYSSISKIYRIRKQVNGVQNTVVMILQTNTYDHTMWSSGDSQIDVEGWSRDGQINICTEIEFYTPAAECDAYCQSEIQMAVARAAKLCTVKRIFVKHSPDQAVVYQFRQDPDQGLYVGPIMFSMRKFSDQKLFALSYESPVCTLNGELYKPPMTSLITHAVNVMQESRHVALIGSPGVGKTILSEHIISLFTSQNPDTYILKLEVSDFDLIASARGRTVVTNFVKDAIYQKKKILIWIDEAQTMITSVNLTTLLQIMDGSSQQQGLVSVVACLNEAKDNLPLPLFSRLTLVCEFKKLSKQKAEELLDYIKEQTDAGVNKVASFANDSTISLRDVYNSVYPKSVVEQLMKDWKGYKYNPPTDKGRR